MVRFLFRCVSTWIAVLGIPGPGRTDSFLPPKPYTQTTGDRRFIFVIRNGNLDHLQDEELREARQIQMAYPKSGMYRNDGSFELIWEFDSYSGRVVLMNDGVHMTRFGQFCLNPEDEAISFFENGHLIRMYRLGELVNDPTQLPRTVRTRRWLRKDSWDGRSVFNIETEDGNFYTFDMKSGEIVSSFRTSAFMRRWIALLLATATVAAGFAVLRRLLKRRSASKTTATQ